MSTGAMRSNIEALRAALEQPESKPTPPGPLVVSPYALLAQPTDGPRVLSRSDRVTEFEVQSIVPAGWDALVEEHAAGVARANFGDDVPPVEDEEFLEAWSADVCAALGAPPLPPEPPAADG
jgi:hypothetical protein